MPWLQQRPTRHGIQSELSRIRPATLKVYLIWLRGRSRVGFDHFSGARRWTCRLTLSPPLRHLTGLRAVVALHLQAKIARPFTAFGFRATGRHDSGFRPQHSQTQGA